MIYIDSREPKKIQDRVKEKFSEINESPEVVKLDYGDFVFGGFDGILVGFERKNLSDLWQSYISGRLINQLEGMLATYDIPVLIVDVGYCPKAIKRHYINMLHILNSVCFKIIVVRCKSSGDLVNELFRFYKKYKNRELISVKRVVDKSSGGDVYDKMLLGIEGIGEELAIEIRKEFDSFYDFIMNIDKLKEMKLNGRSIKKRGDLIGEKIKKRWK